MNERIKELSHVLPFEWVEKSPQNIEKFALLIVRECVDLCELWNATPGSRLAKEIKEHFGVEE